MASLLLGDAFSPARADVYRTVDAQGHVSYSDRPNSAAAQKATVEVQQADPAEAARLSKEQAILKAEEDQRNKRQFIDAKHKEQQARAQQAACANARSRYNVLKDSTRVFKLDADGNRAYYTDAEADARRAEARQAMAVACAK
jgi:hypothetical protein